MLEGLEGIVVDYSVEAYIDHDPDESRLDLHDNDIPYCRA